MTIKRYLVYLIPVALIVAALFSVLTPEEHTVDVALVERGLLRVTIDEEGRTRMRSRYVVSMPASGRIARLEIREGDTVEESVTLTRVYPLPLSAAERVAAQARVDAAEARKQEAEIQTLRIRQEHENSRTRFDRARRLLEEGGVSRADFEAVEQTYLSSERALEAARTAVQAAAADARLARSALLASDQGGASIAITSPAQGVILRLIEQNDRVIPAGTPLVEIGDPENMEVVIDVLSEDAVRITPGATALIDGWGAADTLVARVRRVEPAAFTRVSALGVDEQRVNVIADLVDAPPGLGDGFRVESHIILWESDQALKIPLGALFRHDGGWAVFRVEDDIARLHTVEIGHRGQRDAEAHGGLSEGDRLILHPSNAIHDGVRVKQRD